MAKSPPKPPAAYVTVDAAPIGQQSHWQPVWCAKHHFENIANGLLVCPYGCPPGPSMRAMWCEAYEIGLGGARGGMKTETGRGWLLKGNPWEPYEHTDGHNVVTLGGVRYCGLCVNTSYIAHPRYRALILRENEKDLADWIARARMLYEPMGADVTEKPARIKFPSGATFVLGHMKDSSAYTDYMGQEFHRILFEELTQIPEELLYLRITMSCRSTFKCVKGCKPRQCKCGVLRQQVLSTMNPGGVGHLWVKKRLISIAKPDTLYTDPLTKLTRTYIPALVTDNPYLMRDDQYVTQLEALPEPTRSAWRFGDWDALGGQYFRDFRPNGPLATDPPEPAEARHVIPRGSHPLMPFWPRWLGGDWGYGHGFAVYGACQDPNGQIILNRELVGKDLGSVELGDRIGRTLLPDLEAMSKSGVTPIMDFWLSPDAFDKRDADLTIAESIGTGIQRVLGPGSVHFPDLFNESSLQLDRWTNERFEQIATQKKIGISIRRAQNSRVAGWQYCRELMRFRQIAQPSAEKFDYEYYCMLLRDDPKRAVQYYTSFEARKPEILPKMLIEDTCPGIIEAIPVAVYDEGTEDVLKTETPEDQALDGWRYTLHSQNQKANREPQSTFVQRHIDRVREQEPNVDLNGLIWAARHAEAEYAAANDHMRPFTIPAASSRAAKYRRTQ